MSKDEMKTRSVTLPADLWDEIKERAQQDFRTVNGQVRLLIEKALADDPSYEPDDVDAA